MMNRLNVLMAAMAALILILLGGNNAHAQPIDLGTNPAMGNLKSATNLADLKSAKRALNSACESAVVNKDAPGAEDRIADCKKKVRGLYNKLKGNLGNAPPDRKPRGGPSRRSSAPPKGTIPCPALGKYVENRTDECNCPDGHIEGELEVKGVKTPACVKCPLETPLVEKGECKACPEDKPAWNNSECVACAANELWVKEEGKPGNCVACAAPTPYAQKDKGKHTGVCKSCVAVDPDKPKWDANTLECIPCPTGQNWLNPEPQCVSCIPGVTTWDKDKRMCVAIPLHICEGSGKKVVLKKDCPSWETRKFVWVLPLLYGGKCPNRYIKVPTGKPDQPFGCTEERFRDNLHDYVVVLVPSSTTPPTKMEIWFGKYWWIPLVIIIALIVIILLLLLKMKNNTFDPGTADMTNDDWSAPDPNPDSPSSGFPTSPIPPTVVSPVSPLPSGDPASSSPPPASPAPSGGPSTGDPDFADVDAWSQNPDTYDPDFVHPGDPVLCDPVSDVQVPGFTLPIAPLGARVAQPADRAALGPLPAVTMWGVANTPDPEEAEVIPLTNGKPPLRTTLPVPGVRVDSSLFCHTCRTQPGPEYTFCPSCGSGLKAEPPPAEPPAQPPSEEEGEKRCSYCGKLLQITDQHCKFCGSPITPPCSEPPSQELTVHGGHDAPKASVPTELGHASPSDTPSSDATLLGQGAEELPLFSSDGSTIMGPAPVDGSPPTPATPSSDDEFDEFAEHEISDPVDVDDEGVADISLVTLDGEDELEEADEPSLDIAPNSPVPTQVGHSSPQPPPPSPPPTMLSPEGGSALLHSLASRPPHPTMGEQGVPDLPPPPPGMPLPPRERMTAPQTPRSRRVFGGDLIAEDIATQPETPVAIDEVRPTIPHQPILRRPEPPPEPFADGLLPPNVSTTELEAALVNLAEKPPPDDDDEHIDTSPGVAAPVPHPEAPAPAAADLFGGRDRSPLSPPPHPTPPYPPAEPEAVEKFDNGDPTPIVDVVEHHVEPIGGLTKRELDEHLVEPPSVPGPPQTFVAGETSPQDRPPPAVAHREEGIRFSATFIGAVDAAGAVIEQHDPPADPAAITAVDIDLPPPSDPPSEDDAKPKKGGGVRGFLGRRTK